MPPEHLQDRAMYANSTRTDTSSLVSSPPLATPPDYFPRRLSGRNAENEPVVTDEAGLLAIGGGRVVLGEPGMGKTQLMDELARQLGTRTVSAIRFIGARYPERFIETGMPILIDGLDEAMGRREGDAVNAVIAQLEAAGSPPFVLSCRSREWQARGTSSLRKLYGSDPQLFSIEPFWRSEASLFLASRHPHADPDRVLAHLEDQALEDLYRNPLTLSLLGRVAETDTDLPQTRAALFERVCELLWPEHDDARQDTPRAQLSEAEALAAAGATMAALLFSGAEAVSLAGAAQALPGDVRIADIELLPGAEMARIVLPSNLFQNLGVGRARPIHRVIAEFLAARWLASRLATPRSQRRMLAQLQGSGGVPASLRGLHAWLAFHSPAMAERVIRADPYGVLRYGETASLSPSQAGDLLDALEALAEHDPYFRSSDWNSRSAAGLMIPELAPRIDAVISCTDSNAHLRALLIEGMEGTALAAELAGTIELVMHSPMRFYRERADAADALLPHRDRDWWRQAIETLRYEAGDDGTRLARYLIERIEGDVSDDVFVQTFYAELGLIASPLPRVRKRRVHTLRLYDRLASMPATQRLPGIIALLAEYTSLVPESDWQSANDVANLMSGLLVRAINEGAVTEAYGGEVWNWLGLLKRARHFRRDGDKALIKALQDHPEVRHAAQVHGLEVERRYPRLISTNTELHRRLIAITDHPGDVAWFLDRMGDADRQDQAKRADWRDLMDLAHTSQGFAPGTLQAGSRFMGSDVQLAQYLKRIGQPRKSRLQMHEEKQAAKQARRRRIRFELTRREKLAAHADLLAGTFETTYDAAMVYLGFEPDICEDENPIMRLETWLGPKLAADVLAGFEALLHRTDLPTSHQLADGFASGTTYNFGFAMISALLERLRTGVGLAGLSGDVLTAGLMLNRQYEGWGSQPDLHDALREELELALFKTPDDRIRFARAWFEPAIRARKQQISSLQFLSRHDEWRAAGVALAEEWLRTWPDLPEAVEDELIQCLTPTASLPKLASLAQLREGQVLPNFDHVLTWLAVDVLARFEEVRPLLDDIGIEHPDFLWHLRALLRRERHGFELPLLPEQSAWIVSRFRGAWPNVGLSEDREGGSSGYDAGDFLRGLVNRLANDTSDAACAAMASLIAESADTYSDLLRHLAAEQLQQRAEKDFRPLSPQELGSTLCDAPPSNAEDLRSLVLEELEIARLKLLGEDIDQARDFWSDDGIPYDENRCRDRLAAMIGPELSRYGVQRISEADMPASKRADLAFAHGAAQLPMEVKGQWHDEVWDAASGQLDAHYLIDWRSGQRGIYCVFWFGALPSNSGRRLKVSPEGIIPTTADEMRVMLIDRIPEARRANIAVVVIDLTSGKPAVKAINKASRSKATVGADPSGRANPA